MDKSTGLSSAAARANASSPQGYQSTGLSACWRRYGLVSSAKRFIGPPRTDPPCLGLRCCAAWRPRRGAEVTVLVPYGWAVPSVPSARPLGRPYSRSRSVPTHADQPGGEGGPGDRGEPGDRGGDRPHV